MPKAHWANKNWKKMPSYISVSSDNKGPRNNVANAIATKNHDALQSAHVFMLFQIKQ